MYYIFYTLNGEELNSKVQSVKFRELFVNENVEFCKIILNFRYYNFSMKKLSFDVLSGVSLEIVSN